MRAAPAPAPQADDDIDEVLDRGLAGEAADLLDVPAADLVEERGGGPEGDDDGAFAELDAALAAEEPDEPGRVEGATRRGLFHRRA